MCFVVQMTIRDHRIIRGSVKVRISLSLSMFCIGAWPNTLAFKRIRLNHRVKAMKDLFI